MLILGWLAAWLAGVSAQISDSEALSATRKAVAIVGQMTTAEKINMTTGQGLTARCEGLTGSVPRLGVPEMCLSDGPAGLHTDALEGVSAFPAGVNAASTWDMDLIYQQAVALGQEVRGKGVNALLGPVAGGPLGRSPWAGRNWEGFGSDPYLRGKAGYWHVLGLQDQGIIATPKHYIAYEQETYRFTGILQAIGGYGVVDPNDNENMYQIESVVSNKTLRELYLAPFEETLLAKPLSVMCSYNRINGIDACANHHLLTEVLKGEYNFTGYVVSDYGAVFMAASTNGTMNAGLDVDMPGNEGYWGSDIAKQLNASTISESRLNDAVERLMYAYYAAGQDHNYPNVSFYQSVYTERLEGVTVNKLVNVQANHSVVIRTMAEDSAVLLKNSNTTTGLPLSFGARLAIFGTDAGPAPGNINFAGLETFPANSTNNGTLAIGFGSGSNFFPYLIDPLSAIKQASALNGWQVSAVLEGYPVDMNISSSILSQYQIAINNADTCLVFVSATSGEGLDRASVHLDNRGDELIQYVANQCANTIVVAHLVGVTNMEIPARHDNVTAILNAGLPGQESGNALVSLLTGQVNPSGKLVYTILQNDLDYINTIRTANDSRPISNFTEELLTDYRAADALNLQVRYPFGYGLSYTTFAYSNISANATQLNQNVAANAGRDDVLVEISASIHNVGSRLGSEVAQLYLTFPEGNGEPPKVLRGFRKTSIEPKEAVIVTFPLRKKDLQVWETAINDWILPRGRFTMHVGASSRDLPLSLQLFN